MEIIIGAAVSLFVQWLKNKMGTSEWGTLGILLLVSVVAAALYVTLVETGLWESVAHILVIAGAFYTYVIQRFEAK